MITYILPIRFADQQIGLMLNRDLQLSYRDFGQGLLTSCDQNPKLADIPIQVINFFFYYNAKMKNG